MKRLRWTDFVPLFIWSIVAAVMWFPFHVRWWLSLSLGLAAALLICILWVEVAYFIAKRQAGPDTTI